MSKESDVAISKMKGFTRLNGVVHMIKYGVECEANVVLFPYVCPKCSMTHFEVQTENGFRVAVKLSPEEAEALGHGLIAPTASTEDMYNGA